MKKNILFLVFIGFISVNVFGYCSDPTPWFTISKNDSTDVYIINYTGSKTGKVILTIKNSNGGEVVRRTISNVKDFSLPINFSSVLEDVYTIQIDDGKDKVTQTLNYTNEIAPTYSHVTNVGGGHYLFTASHAGLEKITISISDGNGNLVFEEGKVIKGDAAFLFDLTHLTGNPTFEVTEQTGRSLMIPGSAQVISLKK